MCCGFECKYFTLIEGKVGFLLCKESGFIVTYGILSTEIINFWVQLMHNNTVSPYWAWWGCFLPQRSDIHWKYRIPWKIKMKLGAALEMTNHLFKNNKKCWICLANLTPGQSPPAPSHHNRINVLKEWLEYFSWWL